MNNERNFCERCGKRIGKNDWDIHTCTPPAEQAQKPEGHQEPLCTAAMFDDAFLAKSGLSPDTKLYTSPPQRQPLTLEKLREHWEGAKVLDMTDAEIDFSDYVLIVKDVEALYGIKEKT